MRVLGVMSGTSVDAIDVALARFSLDGSTLRLEPLGHLELPWPAELRAALLAVGTGGGSGAATDAGGDSGAATDAGRGCGPRAGVEDCCRLHAEAGRALGLACARALDALGPADLIACHGQTVHHLVWQGRVVGTLQLGAPAYVHAATGLPVVSDLRSADIAAGGQGAPLASLLDALWLGDVPTAAVNLGGIANVSIVGVDGAVLAGDTGPANALLDAAAAELGLACDADGALAAAGRVDQGALEALLADPYFALPLPKSTGREYFHAGYVAERLGAGAPCGPDLFATLAELTARTVAAAIPATVQRVVASGGGVRHPVLMRRLAELTGVPVTAPDALGIPAAAKEGYLMALIGWLSVHGLPGVVTGPRGPVTRARHAAVLGSLTPPYVSGGLAAALVTPRPLTPPSRLVVVGPPGPGGTS